MSRRPYIPGTVFIPPTSGPAPLGWHRWQWNGIEESISRRADPSTKESSALRKEHAEQQGDNEAEPTRPASAERRVA